MTLIGNMEDGGFNPREIIYKKLNEYGINTENIEDETEFRNISGLDSLDFLQINMDIESEYGIGLGINDYDERSTIRDWIKYLEKREK